MISVIIPVYNVEKYLEKCVRSVLSNTYHDLEVICVNDGSSDNCLEILKRLQAKDDRIVIIDQVNQGVQIARNNGIETAKGEYIAFIDSDDWIHPQYFQTLLNCMKKTGANLAVCQGRKFSEDEEIEIKHFDHIHYKKLTAIQFYKSYYARHIVWGRLFRRQDIENVWFVPEVRMADDTLFNLSVISKLEKPNVYETDIPLYYYLQRSESIVHSSAVNKMVDFVEWYVDNSGNRSQKRGSWAWIRLMQAIKLALSYRYAARVMKDKIGERKVNQILKKIAGEMVPNRDLSLIEKIIHIIMIISPSIYRYFRILQDPTMRVWEEQVKDKK